MRFGAPWFVHDVIGFGPPALLLVLLVRNLTWSAVILAGFAVLGVLEHLWTPAIAFAFRPLLPQPMIPPQPVDHLPVWIAVALVMGALEGLVELAFL